MDFTYPNIVSTGKKLSASPAKEINRLYTELLELSKVGIKKAIRIGELLAQQQEKLAHGKWLSWIKANLEFSDQTARNYIHLYEHREDPKFKNVLNLTEAYRLLAGDTEAALEADPKPVEPSIPDAAANQDTKVSAVEVVIETQEVAVSAVSYVSPKRYKSFRPTTVAAPPPSAEDTIIHLNTQHIKNVLTEIDERAADEDDRQHLAVVLLEDLNRLRREVEDHFSLKNDCQAE